MKNKVNSLLAIIFVVLSACFLIVIVLQYGLIPGIQLPTCCLGEPLEQPFLEQPSWKIIKDETADWETYRNEEYGFEIKYPNDWYEKHYYDDVVELQSVDGKLYISTGGPCPDCVADHGVRISIEIKDNPQGLSSQRFVDQIYDWYVQEDEIEIDDIKIGDIDALKVMLTTDFNAYSPIIYISRENDFLVIRYAQTSALKKEYMSIFDQMLSTFRFID